jgi:hypothetical protein
MGCVQEYEVGELAVDIVEGQFGLRSGLDWTICGVLVER